MAQKKVKNKSKKKPGSVKTKSLKKSSNVESLSTFNISDAASNSISNFGYPLTELAPTYSVVLKNGVQTSANTFQFDVFISAPESFELTAYQVALKYNPLIGNNLTFSYKNSSCQLTNIPAYAVGITSEIINGIEEKLFTFASGPGSDMIKDEKRIGTFIVKNDVTFNIEYPQIQWALGFHRKVKTILTGTAFSDITNWLYFKDLVYDKPLPVELDKFIVKQVGSYVLLEWKTITESNSYGFKVLESESKDGPFVDIGFVPSAGNSNSPKEYSFKHSPELSGIKYYILDMIDVNGETQKSDCISLNFIKQTANTPKKESICKKISNFFNIIINFIKNLFS